MLSFTNSQPAPNKTCLSTSSPTWSQSSIKVTNHYESITSGYSKDVNLHLLNCGMYAGIEGSRLDIWITMAPRLLELNGRCAWEINYRRESRAKREGDEWTLIIDGWASHATWYTPRRLCLRERGTNGFITFIPLLPPVLNKPLCNHNQIFPPPGNLQKHHHHSLHLITHEITPNLDHLYHLPSLNITWFHLISHDVNVWVIMLFIQ